MTAGSTMMPTTALHAPPPWTVVARRQHVLLLESGRFILLIAACLAPLLFVDIRLAQREPNALRHAAVHEAFGYLLPIAAGWALVVWGDEWRQRRRYHWSMPVSHITHGLSRIAAGAVWLAAALLVYCVVGIFVTGDGHLVGATEYGAQFWINVFTGPLLVYLAVTLLPLLTNRSLEWSVGIIAGWVVLSFTAVTFGIDWISDAWGWLVGRPYGLMPALEGGIESARHEIWVAKVSEASRRRIFAYWTTTQEWVIATAIWASVIGTGLALALRKRP